MKQFRKIIMGIALLMVVGGGQVSADAPPPSEDSDVSIGFYGYWVPPETEGDEHPETDLESSPENEAGDRPDAGDGNDPESVWDDRNASAAGNLPATGGAAMLYLRFIGIGLLVLALVFWIWKKKGSKTLSLALAALGLMGAATSGEATATALPRQGHVTFYGNGLTLEQVDPISFGAKEIVNVDMVYYALAAMDEDGNPRPHVVQLSDFRGTGQGWSLHVRKNGPLANEDLEHAILEGAEIHILNSEAVSYSDNLAPSTFDIILDGSGALQRAKVAATDEGMMTWLKVKDDVAFIDGTWRNRNIQFHIPGTTPRSAGNYYTDMTWILSNVPL
ncbi:MAG: WxL domain-containing protein [Turicibacter sp.]|nr:WxL domain-containing protein [Turicibacter sp.]